ncbi:hypothetical protein FQA47_000355 [Oryzias melastigma]|uniref:Uncharacterized protein n=1 Tax=Oryzias melastigma TaxID=30732 RepID=A0A834FC70_ORYME|nr:hypothetical protein FQA47_000355 [Oryzias melastigma]
METEARLRCQKQKNRFMSHQPNPPKKRNQHQSKPLGSAKYLWLEEGEWILIICVEDFTLTITSFWCKDCALRTSAGETEQDDDAVNATPTLRNSSLSGLCRQREPSAQRKAVQHRVTAD